MLRLCFVVGRVGAVLAAVVVVALAHCAMARADFTETFCNGVGSVGAPWTVGGPATAWTETNDACASGGGLGWDAHLDPLPAGSYGSEITAPPGEEFTGESLSFGAEPDSDGDVFVSFGYGPATSILAEFEDGPAGLSNVPVTETLPDTTTIWTRTDCDDANGCTLANFIDVIQIAAMSITVHDTGIPAVSATGGSLAADGATITGDGTVLFNATDTGSGVQKVTLSLGANVVAESDSTCQAESLTPCPSDVSGTLNADTATLPDGTYPVILTAYDVSGDQAPAQVGTVTLANHNGVRSIPAAKVARGRPRPLKVAARFTWDWQGASTRLVSARFGKLPKRGAVAVSCVGDGCPFRKLTARHTTVTKLTKRLTGRSFTAGDKVKVTVSAPHRTAERGTMTIQAGALPVVNKAKRPKAKPKHASTHKNKKATKASTHKRKGSR